MSQIAKPFSKKAGGFTGFGKGEFGDRQRKVEFAAAEVRPPDLESGEFEVTLYRLKDSALAKRVVKLKEKYPDGTMPELVTVDYLSRNQIDYMYQLQYGPRNVEGSTRPDFLLPNRGNGMVWEVNGEYFHTERKTPESDEARRRKLLNSEISGIVIKSVIALWENDIYTDNPRVFELALAGIGMR